MIPSTFGERFMFARLVQALRGVTETDGEFAQAIGVGSSSITAYKTADEAPPAGRALVIAKRCGVDPGWLSFGEDTAAPAPTGWESWLGARRPASESLKRAVDAVSKSSRGAQLEPKDVPAPRGSGLVKNPREKGKESA